MKNLFIFIFTISFTTFTTGLDSLAPQSIDPDYGGFRFLYLNWVKKLLNENNFHKLKTDIARDTVTVRHVAVEEGKVE